MPELFSRAAGYMLVAIANGALPSLVIAALCGVGAGLLTWNRRIATVCFAVAIVGSGLGLMIGTSRESVVGAFLPALITLLGGLIVYVMPKAETAHSRVGKQPLTKEELSGFIFAAVGALVLSSVMGANFGGAIRDAARESERRYDEWLKGYETVQLPIEKQILESQLFPDADSVPADTTETPDTPAE